jgi:predicted nucleic acid-binding protein
MVLVDTSAWIAFFKDEKGAERLQMVLETSAIAICDPILIELLPRLRVKKQDVLIDLVILSSTLPTTPDWSWILESQTERAKKGKRLLGLADWLILDTARQSKVPLLTLDLALADAAMDVGVGLT